jgi:membrane associated rhomboid family serine protease
MGIYDREYYRREGPSYLDAFTRHGRVCKWLIAVNIIVFVLQLVTSTAARQAVDDDGWPAFDRDGTPVLVEPTTPSITDTFQLDVHKVLQGQVWRLFTYAFLHDPGGLWHIFLNMLALWWFGTDVEDLYGPREFLTFYFIAAVLGGIAFQLAWMLKLSHGLLCIGASGAVTAVMVLFAMHYPTRIIYLWFFPIPVWLLVVFQVCRDLFGFLSGHAGPTAVTVHLAGAAFGFLYYKANIRLWNYVPAIGSFRKLGARPKLRVYREEPRRPVAVDRSANAEHAEHFEAKLDAVLEKVARYGQSSLTESERELLLRASEVYKRRRS